MLVDGNPTRTIWPKPDDPDVVRIIDQRHLPHAFVVEDLRTVEEAAVAIREMHVRGAGLIGATAGFGMLLAALEAATLPPERRLDHLQQCGAKLKATRPTAVNLAWAVDRQLRQLATCKDSAEFIAPARTTAQAIADEDAEACRRIGEHGVTLIEAIAAKKPGEPVRVLTHCNAGWLAFVDHGSATAPIYEANRRGIPLEVWVDETRPRNQGAALTAWELANEGVPHRVIVDNAGGHLMQHGLVDIVIVGSDRTTHTGDVANKIGTYLKALAARDNGIPFYAALPSSTLDWQMRDGVAEIPIEERDPDEVRYVTGLNQEGKPDRVLIMPEQSRASNHAFDVTPARLVSGLITERGICAAEEGAIRRLYPEKGNGNG